MIVPLHLSLDDNKIKQTKNNNNKNTPQRTYKNATTTNSSRSHDKKSIYTNQSCFYILVTTEIIKKIVINLTKQKRSQIMKTTKHW